MIRLLKLQLRNIFHNKLFYICLLLTIATPIVTLITVNSFKAIPPKVFPEIKSFLASEVGIIGVIFIAIFACLDFNEGTTKNIIARGYTRTQLLLSKYIATLIGLFIMYIVTIILTFIFFAKNGLGYESSMLYLFINSIVGIIAYTIFYATMSFLLEKNGSAIIACLFIPNILSVGLGLIDSKLKLNISNYWIDNISNQFLKKPTFQNLLWSILFYGIYIVAFSVIGTLILKKKEIK